MVGIKRFIIGLAAALHTCIEMSRAKCNNPENGCSADKIVWRHQSTGNYLRLSLFISKLSAVSRFLPDFCSSIANGWHQKVYHLISSRVAHVYRNESGVVQQSRKRL
jgi:hypothetical protein